jgi:hypothetical protein
VETDFENGIIPSFEEGAAAPLNIVALPKTAARPGEVQPNHSLEASAESAVSERSFA